jgi:hypothetical protein
MILSKRGQVATLLGLKSETIKRRGRYPDTVQARSVLCYWASRCLGIRTFKNTYSDVSGQSIAAN